MSQLPEVLGRDGNRLSALPRTIDFVGEVVEQGPELALVPQFLGRYEIIEFLGSGSFSRVYLAKDSQLGRMVALKVLRSERFDSAHDLATFRREAKTIAGLDHPGIVSVHDVVAEANGVQFIVMQYIKGMTLRDRMDSGTTTYSEAANIVCRVAEAMHVAHTQNVFHRDLKPANILLDTAGRPHIADFGLAVLEHQQHHHTGEVAGTLIYMAPEQIRGEAQWLDGRSDIWSLGVIFYSLLTGRHPFLGQGDKTVSDEILYREPRPPRQINECIPKELERICLKCLNKQVKERYFSAFDLAEDLKNWLDTEASVRAPISDSVKLSEIAQSTADSVRQPPKRASLRQIALGIAGSAVFLLAAIGAIRGKGVIPIPVVKPPANSPFDLDSYAIPGRWYPLLEQKPTLYTSTPRDSSKWIHDPQLQDLLVDVPAPIYLDLGETKSRRFTLEATITSQSWLGSVGLYWGRKPAPTMDPNVGNQPQLHCLFFLSYDWKGERIAYLERERTTHTTMPTSGNMTSHGTGTASAKIEWPVPVTNHLEVRVFDDSLKVIWNGQHKDKMPKGANVPGLAKLSADGRFGIFVGCGTFQLSDVRIRLER